MDISKIVNVPQRTLVWPSCVPLEGFPVSVSTQLCLQGALSDRAGNDGDSIGLRDYRHGDRLRNIHWAQSVRSQKLMVRERQLISSTESTVILDLSPDDHDGDGINSSFEWAIRIAASICSHLHEASSPVRVVCVGLIDQTDEDNRNGIRPIMDFLAKLPTLASALKSAESSMTGETPEEQRCVSNYRNKVPSRGRVFSIGSSQTMRLDSGGLYSSKAKVTQVVVDVEGFQIEDMLQWTDGAERTRESQLCKEEIIFVQTPQSAAAELASGWNRSFSDAI